MSYIHVHVHFQEDEYNLVTILFLQTLFNMQIKIAMWTYGLHVHDNTHGPIIWSSISECQSLSNITSSLNTPNDVNYLQMAIVQFILISSANQWSVYHRLRDPRVPVGWPSNTRQAFWLVDFVGVWGGVDKGRLQMSSGLGFSRLVSRPYRFPPSPLLLVKYMYMTCMLSFILILTIYKIQVKLLYLLFKNKDKFKEKINKGLGRINQAVWTLF